MKNALNDECIYIIIFYTSLQFENILTRFELLTDFRFFK